MNVAAISLKGEQLLLGVALCENHLRHPHRSDGVPTNKEIMLRFGWSRKKLDGKLDRLCQKFDQYGVAGLIGTISAPAENRKTILVHQLLTSRLVTHSHLSLLDKFS